MTSIKIMTFNILCDGLHEAGDRRDKIAAVVMRHNPDVLCMQEGGDDDYWIQFAQQNGYKVFENLRGEFNPALFSRIDIVEHDTDKEIRMVYAKIQIGSSHLGIYSTHLWHEAHRDDLRVQAAEKLYKHIKGKGDEFVCLAGDFNSRSAGEWGEQLLVEYASKWCGETVTNDMWIKAAENIKQHGFTDCYRKVNNDAGYTHHPTVENVRAKFPEIVDRLNLLPNALTVPVCVRLDYVFANKALTGNLKECFLDESEAAINASDHLPIVASFSISDGD